MEIRIEHLNKKYGKQCALKDISLHIPVGMYGPVSYTHLRAHET